jgi:hypothetical protein
MDHGAIERATQRLQAVAEGRPEPAVVEATLERTRGELESLAQAAAELESTLPIRVEAAVQDGLREQVLPVGRHIAEIHGLLNQAIRRLERIEGDLAAEQHARVDDLALLIDLITSGWKSVDERLSRFEENLGRGEGAIVYRIEERRTG